MRVCQSAQQLPALLQQIFVLRRLTDCYLAAAAGSKAADNRYANLLLALFVYILEEVVFLSNKHVILKRNRGEIVAGKL